MKFLRTAFLIFTAFTAPAIFTANAVQIEAKTVEDVNDIVSLVKENLYGRLAMLIPVIIQFDMLQTSLKLPCIAHYYAMNESSIRDKIASLQKLHEDLFNNLVEDINLTNIQETKKLMINLLYKKIDPVIEMFCEELQYDLLNDPIKYAEFPSNYLLPWDAIETQGEDPVLHLLFDAILFPAAQ